MKESLKDVPTVQQNHDNGVVRLRRAGSLLINGYDKLMPIKQSKAVSTVLIC